MHTHDTHVIAEMLDKFGLGRDAHAFDVMGSRMASVMMIGEHR